jgi:hypothetical protein
VFNPDGTPKLNSSNEVVTTEGDVELQFRITIDARTNAGFMGNEWNGAIVNNLGFRIAHAASDNEIKSVFNLTDDQLSRLEWSNTRSFYILTMS